MTPLARFLQPTRLIPTDGIVRTTANEITKGAGTDLEKARAIYDWIVDNTFRDPKTRGCGLGDIRFMLESGNLSGKCADLNALFVGLCRAAGIPARDLYGLRVAPSAKGLRSLGLSSADATRAQHCRAEVYLTGYGWVPVDPADVRKVALEEPPGHLAIGDERVKIARRAAVRIVGDELDRLQLRARRRRCADRRASRSPISCTRKARPPKARSTASIRSTSSTRSQFARSRIDEP